MITHLHKQNTYETVSTVNVLSNVHDLYPAKISSLFEVISESYLNKFLFPCYMVTVMISGCYVTDQASQVVLVVKTHLPMQET